MASRKKQLLVIDSDKKLQRQLQQVFSDYEVQLASNRKEGMAQMQRLNPAVVLLSLELEPQPQQVTEGMIALEEIQRLAADTRIIVLTHSEDRAIAVEVIGLGAQDCYHKPIEPDPLRLIVMRAFHVHDLEAENQHRQHAHKEAQFPLVAVGSAHMMEIIAIAQRVAPIDVPILLGGEEGTGKALLAEAIHRLSGRAEGRFINVNCAAIPEALFEIELFGHEKGAINSTTPQRIGDLELADKGTLFLNNICQLSLDNQGKLLRFLRDPVVRRLEGEEQIAVDIRLICASYRDLEAMVAQRTFREDLYALIKDVSLHLSPLKDRQGDAVLLAQVFVKQFSDEFKLQRKNLSRDAIAAIEAYQWPGNIRELESKIKRAIIMAAGNQITAEDLALGTKSNRPAPKSLKQAKEEAERRALLEALAETDNNIAEAAMILGVARPTVYKLMDKYGVRA